MTEQHKTVFDILFRKILTSQNHYFCFILEISVHVRIHANQMLYTCLSKKKTKVYTQTLIIATHYCEYLKEESNPPQKRKRKKKNQIFYFIILFFFNTYQRWFVKSIPFNVPIKSGFGSNLLVIM